MKKSDFKTLLEDQIAVAARKIIDKGAPSDDVAFGKLKVFLSLRRTLEGKAAAEDIGFWDAINDTLQILRVLDRNETIFSGLQT
jgi:hypothetical protein